MRVLVLSTVFPNPVAPTFGVFVRERVRHVAQRCEVQVIAPAPWFPLQRRLRLRVAAPPPLREEQYGIPIHHPPVFSVPGVAKSLDGLFYFLSLLRFVRRLRRSFAFDVIDAHFAYPDGLGAVLLGRRLGCPVAVTLRGYEVETARRSLLRPQLRFALGQAHVMAVSDSLGRLVNDLGASPPRLRVVPNAVDTSLFRPGDRAAARQRLGLPAERTILLGVGAFIADKGHERVLDALPSIIAGRDDVLYVAVGNSGGRHSRLDAIRARVQREGLSRHVRLAVARPHAEIPIWMAAADLFCLATRREGWCNALTEALACGLPVVTTAVGGNPEIVRDGEDGWLVPFFDAATFAQAVGRALEAGWDRDAIARRASARDWKVVADEVIEELDLARRSQLEPHT